MWLFFLRMLHFIFFTAVSLLFFSTFSGLICLSLVVLCFDKKSSIKPANLVVKLKLLLWTDKKYTHFEIKFSFFSLRIRCWALLMLLLLLSLIVSWFYTFIDTIKFIDKSIIQKSTYHFEGIATNPEKKILFYMFHLGGHTWQKQIFWFGKRWCINCPSKCQKSTV